MNLRHLICGIRGHRISVTPKDETLFALDTRENDWEITAEVRCWCKRTHYYEGHQA